MGVGAWWGGSLGAQREKVSDARLRDRTGGEVLTFVVFHLKSSKIIPQDLWIGVIAFPLGPPPIISPVFEPIHPLTPPRRQRRNRLVLPIDPLLDLRDPLHSLRSGLLEPFFHLLLNHRQVVVEEAVVPIV